jgi:diguanylate cyclase (GGDEF)-like protein
LKLPIFSFAKKKRIWIFLFVIISIVLSLFATLLYIGYWNTMTEETRERAQNISILTAHLIEQNIESYRNLYEVQSYENGSYDLHYYQSMNELLRQIKKELEVDYIYTEKRTGSDTIEYLLDGENPESSFFSAIGSEDYLGEPERLAYETKQTQTSELIESEGWGKYISGFSPIFDPRDGTVLGLAGVDFSGDTLHIASFRVFWLLISILTFLATLLASIVFFLISKRMELLKTDYLTKLNSKQYFERQILEEIKDTNSRKLPFILLMIDIDRFKLINDSYGHQTGDLVLKYIASTIQENTRRCDFCARIGGDEFTVILKNLSWEEAFCTAERIQEKIARTLLLEKENLKCTVSIGVCQWEQGLDAKEVMKRADVALYKAKEQGKNCVVSFTELS